MSEPEEADESAAVEEAAADEEEAAPLYPVPMTDLISGREDGTNVIVSTGPDVCLTPVGSSLVPVAYSSVAFAGDSTRVSPTVLDNECADFHLNSRICTSTGHEPGVGAGVAVPGYQGEAFVQTASPTVFTDGWATTRHRDPAMINRPGTGAVEPQFERTSYYDQIVARIQGRGEAESLDICYASDVEANMPSRDVEPGTNVSVESGNGAAILLTGATAPPEEDLRRQPGETVEEYSERIRPIINGRPDRGPGGVDAKLTELETIADAVTSDPDFYAWQQGIDPELFHDPLSHPGVFRNELLSRTANGDPASMMAMRPMMNPYDFIAADGNVYSTNGGPVPIQGSHPTGMIANMAALDQRYLRWREEAGLSLPDDYRLSEAIPLMVRADGTIGPRTGMAVTQPAAPPRQGQQPGQPARPGGPFELAPRVHGQLNDPRLGSLQGQLTPERLNQLANNPSAMRLMDARSGHINVIQDVGGRPIRITVPRDAMRIISVGPMRPNQITNGIASGRFIPMR